MWTPTITSDQTFAAQQCALQIASSTASDLYSGSLYLFHAGSLHRSVGVVEVQHGRLPGQPTGRQQLRSN